MTKVGPHRPLALLAALLLAGLPAAAPAEGIRIGDVQINPGDFSAENDPENRLAKCLACHGDRGGGDIDFGPDASYGTPAIRGMREAYLEASLIAYRAGTRKHQEMSAVAALLDDETIDFMARALSEFEAPPSRSGRQIEALAEEDPLFHRGQAIALRGIPEYAVPACAICHGRKGEGSTVGPRLAGQNARYIESQFEAFSNGDRRTEGSAYMLPVASGLGTDDVRAVARYYARLADTGEP